MAIYFKKLRWKNFISTGNIFTEIDLNRSKSTLIVGENGAGKSTILDALDFVLFNKPFRSINKTQLLNSITKKNLVCEIEFDVGKNEYLIIRGMKPNIFEIYCNGTLMNQDSATRDYQEYLEKTILKLNYKSFNQIVVLGSANFVPFMQLPAGVRRQVIEDLLDIQIFSNMNVLLKERVSINKESIINTDYNIKLYAEKIEMHKKHLASLRTNNDELIAQKHKQIAEINVGITKAESDIDALNVSNTELDANIGDVSKTENKLDKLSVLSTQIDSKLSKLKKDVKFFEENDDCPTCRQGIEHTHKEVIISKNVDQITEVEEGRQKIITELEIVNEALVAIAELNKQITANNKKISDLNVQIRTWQSFIKSLEKEIEPLLTSPLYNDEAQIELTELKKQLKEGISNKEELQREKQVLDVASVLLKDGGIKTKIIKQYIPIINKLINKYLSAMEFFVNFELNENFEETIKSRFRDEFSYASFSEGEKLRIDLALLFAWRAVAKQRNSSSTNLLIMDEVFDSSLDSGGTEEFIKILDGLTQDTNVFIISHKGATLFDKFHSVIKFEKTKNFSRIAE